MNVQPASYYVHQLSPSELKYRRSTINFLFRDGNQLMYLLPGWRLRGLDQTTHAFSFRIKNYLFQTCTSFSASFFIIMEQYRFIKYSTVNCFLNEESYLNCRSCLDCYRLTLMLRGWKSGQGIIQLITTHHNINAIFNLSLSRSISHFNFPYQKQVRRVEDNLVFDHYYLPLPKGST